MATIRVLIADDEPLIRRALSAYLEADAGIEVVGEARNGLEAVSMARALRPDVAIVDLRMPRQNGTTAVAAIVEQAPETKCLCVTSLGTERAVLDVIRAGARGYIVKDALPDDFAQAVRTVHDGGYAFGDHAVGRLIENARSRPEKRALTEAEALTPRELEVVQLLVRGLSNGEIATELHIGESTVKTHVSTIMAKWQVRDRVQVVIRASEVSLDEI
ncbi:response regulator transcription factor [Microbacterium amylolyticum]|uniref:DNA-binding NarL/FixJ family response regulator n=1 Tax=Microbacterium amylolyticum TaxID=936337 RepID=A0ABS4ZHS8_9MICO|nr:response regulator transcription factor [Microbacterium amylolyticum]MBP2436844.1 DNA-binding NarL/FixJ family response regulator [Microbacterium amylolyticum]